MTGFTVLESTMLRGLTLKQLRSLRAIARTGSLTGAAADQALTTPAIHSQIKNLELIVGAPVLARDAVRRRLVPTSCGQVLVNAADRIEGILASTRDNLAALDSGKSGHVKIGFESTGRYFAPKLVARLRRHCPEIDISFSVGNRSQVVEMLGAEKIDLAVMGRPPREPVVEAFPVGAHPYGIVVPSDHPLVADDTYDPERLVAQTILAREPGSGTRILLDRYLDQIEGYGTARLLELESNETIKESVMAGLGVAMLSLHVIEREIEGGRLRLLRWPGLPIMRYWYLVRRNDAQVAESSDRVKCAIIEERGSFLPGRTPSSDQAISGA